MTGSTAAVLVGRDGPVMTVTLNRPERRNGVDGAMCAALYEALRNVATSDARVVVLRGAGDDFCIGADLGGTPEPCAPPTLEALEPIYQSSVLLHGMPQVTIAAVDGGCAGAGMGWACSCDFRFASDAARFSTAFLNVGVSGDMGLAWTLTRLVGPGRARELLLFPHKFGAEEAKDLGLVTRVFARSQLHDQVAELAQSLAGRDPFALRMHKANLVSAEKLDFTSYIDIESARHLHTAGKIATAANSRPGQLG